MAYLGLALFAEGPTDQRFLRPLLRRLSEHMCAKYAIPQVEVSDVVELHSPSHVLDQNRETRIIQAALDAQGSWHVLFIHTDGAGDPERARAERVEPACCRIANKLQDRMRQTVAVLPVRETEAWCLPDGDGLREAFGTTKSDVELGLPGTARDVESILDPKHKLNEVYRATHPQRLRQQRRGSSTKFYDLIGEYVSLSVLAEVPAFQELTRELYTALIKFGYFREALQ